MPKNDAAHWWTPGRERCIKEAYANNFRRAELHCTWCAYTVQGQPCNCTRVTLKFGSVA